MIALKLVTLLFLAFAVVSLNLQSTHDAFQNHRKVFFARGAREHLV